MFKRFKGLIAGVLIGSLFTSGIVFGKEVSEMAELFYNNIKIYIDGAEIVPKDPNGNIVEPFTMNGTTYLPVRAISNALGKDVEWDGATQSVYIGKKDQTKPDNYLDRIQYTDYKTNKGAFHRIVGKIIDYSQKEYTNGILLDIIREELAIENDNDNANTLISYPLNSQYSSMKGNIVIPKEISISTVIGENKNDSDKIVYIYGDTKLLYNNRVTASMPINIDLNVRGVNVLTIKVKNQPDANGSYIALTDLALYK